MNDLENFAKKNYQLNRLLSLADRISESSEIAFGGPIDDLLKGERLFLPKKTNLNQDQRIVSSKSKQSKV